MATIEDRQAARDAKFDELHEKLAGAVEELVSGDDWKRALTFAANFRSRSFNNTLLIWAQHQASHQQGFVPEPMPTYVTRYKQWPDVDARCRRGNPGYQILAPVTGRSLLRRQQMQIHWRRLKKFEKPRPGEVVRSKMIGVRPAYVRDASQTAGDPIPELPAPTLLEGEAPAGLWEGLANSLKPQGSQRWAMYQIHHRFTGQMASRTTQIRPCSCAPTWMRRVRERAKTLVHELGHVLMHDPENADVRLHRGIGEVEAKSVALMIGAAHGMDTSGYTIPYVTTWAAQVDGKEPGDVIKSTGERVRATTIRF